MLPRRLRKVGRESQAEMYNDSIPPQAARLLERAFQLANGDTHKPVDLQKAWLDLGLPVGQMQNQMIWLVQNNYFLPSEEQGKPVLHLTDKTIKRMASLQTRR